MMVATPYQRANRRRAALVVAAAALPPGVVLGLIGLAGGPVVAVAAFVFVTVVVALAVWTTADWRVARWVGGREADPTRDARFVNVVEGLCIGAGLPLPRLVVVEDEGLNALAAGHRPGAATVAVTAGLLGSLSRVELEGVLAEAVVRLKRLDPLPATLAAGAGPLARRVGRPGEGEDGADLGAVALTRYPPGLASALEKLAERGTAVTPPATRVADLWLADPRPPGIGTGAERLPLEERAEALREL
jgi:heat shock protein HtpX